MSHSARPASIHHTLMCCAAAVILLLAAGCGGSTDEPTEPPRPDPPTQIPEETPMPAPTSTSTPEPEDREDLPAPVLAAIDAVAMEAGVSPANVAVLRYVAREWPSTALGCPRPGFSYAQVVTDGYEVHLEVDDGEYEYHTNLQNSVVLCSRPES